MRLVRPCREELAALFTAPTRNVWVCSPWISGEGAALLRGVMGKSVSSLRKLEVWLRLSVDDARAGLTDYRAVAAWLDELRIAIPELEVQLWTSPNLHAKTVWTDSGALVGSANLTLNGYERNVELSVRLEAHEAAPQWSIRDALRGPMQAVTEERWKGFVASSVDIGVAAPAPVGETMPGGPGWQEFVATLLSERPPVRGIR